MRTRQHLGVPRQSIFWVWVVERVEARKAHPRGRGGVCMGAHIS